MTDFNRTPAAGTVPTAYVRGMSPQDPSGYPVYVVAELRKLEKSIASLLVLVPQAAFKAPEAPVENMIRYSKSPWRPVVGQTDDKWVTYVSGAWVYLPTA